MDLIRNDTAKQYRGIRKLLRGNPPIDPDPVDYDNKFISIIGVIIVALLFFIIASCSRPTKAFADTIKDSEAIKAVIGEAENQGYTGMLYVACTIRNRGTLRGVYGLKSYRVIHHLYTDRIYDKAKFAWESSANPEVCKVVKGAVNWEDVKAFGDNYWTRKMKLVLTYKDHNFYTKN